MAQAVAIIVCALCNRQVMREYRHQKVCRGCASPAPPTHTSFTREIVLDPYVLFTLPLSGAFSKNRMLAFTKDGAVLTRKTYREARASLTWSTKCALHGVKFTPGQKVWIDILVEKTEPAADAVNVVDIVCDGVKEGLGIDDRWFAIRRLDWEMAAVSPRLVVGVGQELSALAPR